MKIQRRIDLVLARVVVCLLVLPVLSCVGSEREDLWMVRLNGLADWQVDLTSEIGLIQNTNFLSWRGNITISDGRLLAKMVQSGKLSGLQAVHAVLLCTGLSESDFTKTMEELITGNTADDVLLRIVRPYYPYGPGLARTGNQKELRIKLHEVRASGKLTVHTQNAITDVLDGVAAQNYSQFVKNPELFGFDKETVRLLKRKKP
jgi:hypothetical protein